MSHVSAEATSGQQLQGITFTPFVNSRTGAQRLAAWRADFPPHTAGEPHTMSEDEVLHVLEGTLDVEVAGSRFVAGKGDAILVPTGARFVIGNGTDDAARAWVVTLVGMTATMERDGRRFVPPWAQ
jgi:ethanolamine utilization protein EutQ (cupin superfamily)